MSRVATFSAPYLRGLRGLGQDVYDPVTGDYVAALPIIDNPVAGYTGYGPPAPTPADLTYDQTVSSGSTPNPRYNFDPAAPSSPAVPSSAISSAIATALAPKGASVVARPSPIVSVPLSMSTVGMWLSNNSGIVALGAVLMISAALFGGGGRRR